MTILEVNRGNTKITVRGKTVHVPGEMFFAQGDKIGFAVDLKNLKNWDFPNQNLELTQSEIDDILSDVQAEFTKRTLTGDRVDICIHQFASCDTERRRRNNEKIEM